MSGDATEPRPALDPAVDLPLCLGDTAHVLSTHGGCPRCDTGLMVHAVSDGEVYVVPLHLDGAHDDGALL